jgi:NAD(P)-dependent dehydrogenase (short-subunit alcohol dehydrogenase family)
VDTIAYRTATSTDLEQTVKLVEALGRRIVPVEADVRSSAALEAAAAKGVEELGRLDYVVANAGIASMGRALDLTEAQWQTMIDINLTGVWRTIKATVPHILAGGKGGAVVITSSMAATVTDENISHYTAAKTGLTGFMRVLAKELAPSNIRVTCVLPGIVETDMVVNEATFRIFRPDLEHPTHADFLEVASKLLPLPTTSVGVDQVSAAVAYLLSDDAKHVTGISHVISGGRNL